MLLKSLITIFTPFSCQICGIEGSVVCQNCLPKIVVTKTATCYRCNRLSDGGRTCRSCRSSSYLSGALVASHYDGEVKELIRGLKYQRQRENAQILAQIMVPLAKNGKFDVITSVPAAPARFRGLGFNHAGLIAQELAAEAGLPYRELLWRHRLQHQVGHNRRERLEQAKGNFFAKPHLDLNSQRVLVVDDVMTTGATLAECAQALKAAGAKSIWAAVAAKH